MAFKEVSTLDAETTTAIGGKNKKTGKSNPSSAEGYFLGSRKVESKKAKDGFAYIHFLQTPKGNLGVWGKTDLDRKLGSVTPGTMVRISHTGMQATPNGEMYKYKVEVDPDNTIEVTAQNNGDESYGNAGTDGGSNEESYTNDSAEEDDSDRSEYETAEANQASALSALERKNKVEALLKGKGRNTRN